MSFSRHISFEEITCGGCGVLWAMTTDFYNKKRSDHTGFSCPNGCNRVFSGETRESKLERQLARKQRQLEAEAGRALILEQQNKEVKGNYKRLRVRIQNGVCPCCSRTFENLASHIKTKHPDFADNKLLKTLRISYGFTQTSLAKEIGLNSDTYVCNYENDNYLPETDKRMIEDWMESNK